MNTFASPVGDAYPDDQGHFGPYGGRYVGETLMPAILELEQAYASITPRPDFQAALEKLLRDYTGRPTPLFHARRLSEKAGGAAVFFAPTDPNCRCPLEGTG